MSEHSFEVEIAREFGVNAAILFKNICFWIEKNKANGKNYFDGEYWTYNSKRAFSILFPYMSERQVGTALQKLIDARMIKIGNYNADKRDQTLWYALDINGARITQKCNSHLTKVHNGNGENVRPLSYKKTSDINTNINTYNSVCAPSDENCPVDDGLHDPAKKVSATRFTPPTVEEVAEYCRERGNAVDAERFCDFYASKGWQVGKNTMKDWRAAVRTWEKRDEQDCNRDGDAFSAVLRREMERIGGKT